MMIFLKYDAVRQSYGQWSLFKLCIEYGDSFSEVLNILIFNKAFTVI